MNQYETSVLPKSAPCDEAMVEKRSPLRFLACGSVDDGKSTLMGRLLFEAGAVTATELVMLQQDSRRYGTCGDDIDYALLVDGLASEREQGITIDVAYRYFSTSSRAFIVADAPGHPQYTGNMVTGASHCDLVILMIDARYGMQQQSKRHAVVASMLGIKHAIVAINKIDLIDYDQAKITAIEMSFLEFAEKLAFTDITLIPVSAKLGDNVVQSSARTPWYDGPTVLQKLNTVDIVNDVRVRPFLMSVQWVNRPNHEFRGYAGQVTQGQLRVGDVVSLSPSRRQATVARIIADQRDVPAATSAMPITVVFQEAMDVSRGEVLTTATEKLQVGNHLLATVMWLSESPLITSREYVVRLGTQTMTGMATRIKYGIDINELQKQPLTRLQQNEFASVEWSFTKPLSCLPYALAPSLGAFIIIDRFSQETVGCGMVEGLLQRGQYLFRHDFSVDRVARERLNCHQGCAVWLTGLSAAGKSTIANLVEQQLHARGIHTMVLDGDDLRQGLNKDLGFSEVDRVENVRRFAEVAKLMVRAGLVTLVPVISPFRADRQMAKRLIGIDSFVEVYVKAELAQVEARDPKGLYRKARAGEIKHFTGINSPYEVPQSADMVLDTVSHDAEHLAQQLLDYLSQRLTSSLA